MKKIGILTIIDSDNYGNRLQNLALQQTLKKLDYEVYTIKNEVRSNLNRNILKTNLLIMAKKIQYSIKHIFNYKRYSNFKSFNKNIKFTKNYITGYNAKKFTKNFDKIVVGSDQIWNIRFRKGYYIDMLEFADSSQKIAYAASFGTSNINPIYEKEIREALQDFKAISIREDRGKEIIEELTSRQDIQTLIDPTMLLTSKEWEEFAKKPDMLKETKYILCYFLDQITEARKALIETFAKKNDCSLIYLLDKNSPFYNTGPSEFLWLEKNAFLICTDSFHSSVFSILFEKPFVVFDRNNNKESMSSRIDTLLNKFHLTRNKFAGTIPDDILKCDYKESYHILEEERKKSLKFLTDNLK